MIFYVFYRKVPDFFLEDVPGTIEEMKEKYVYLREVSGMSPEEVFMKMQGCNWSPHGEARELIRSKGLKHTSMSVGDILIDNWTGLVLLTVDVGFKPLPFLGIDLVRGIQKMDALKADVKEGVFIGKEDQDSHLVFSSGWATMTEEEANEENEPDDVDSFSQREMIY